MTRLPLPGLYYAPDLFPWYQHLRNVFTLREKDARRRCPIPILSLSYLWKACQKWNRNGKVKSIKFMTAADEKKNHPDNYASNVPRFWWSEFIEIIQIPTYFPTWISTVYHTNIKHLTLARIRCFVTFGRTGGGVGATPPWRFQTKRRRACGKDQQIALAEYSRESMADQRSNFRKFYDFSTLWVHISKTIYRSGMGPSPVCSPFNSAQNEVFWCISVEYLGRIVLIDDAVSHRWRHRSDLWRHESVTWHTHMIGISTMDT